MPQEHKRAGSSQLKWLLLVSVLLAVHCTERRRAFWLGFAVFGWAGVVASLVPPVESRLLTTKLLAYLDSDVMGPKADLAAVITRDQDYVRMLKLKQSATVDSRVATRDGRTQADMNRVADRLFNACARLAQGSTASATRNFVRIGHSLIALVLAWVGGHVSRFLYVRNRETDGSENSNALPA